MLRRRRRLSCSEKRSARINPCQSCIPMLPLQLIERIDGFQFAANCGPHDYCALASALSRESSHVGCSALLGSMSLPFQVRGQWTLCRLLWLAVVQYTRPIDAARFSPVRSGRCKPLHLSIFEVGGTQLLHLLGVRSVANPGVLAAGECGRKWTWVLREVHPVDARDRGAIRNCIQFASAGRSAGTADQEQPSECSGVFHGA